MRDGRIDERALDRFLDDLVAGRPAAGGDLDPGVLETVRAVRAMAAAPLPKPSRERVGPAVRAEIARLSVDHAKEQSMPQAEHLAIDRPILTPNGRAEPRPIRAFLPALPANRARRRQLLAQFATALLLIVTLGAAYVAFAPWQRHPAGGPGAQPAGTPATTIAAPVTSPVAFVWETKGGLDLPFNAPYQIALDPRGNLWVADGRNHRFQIFAPDGTFLEAWGTFGSAEGQFNFIASDGPSIGLSYGAVVFDGAGNVYVADAGNHRVQKFGPDRSFLTAWGTHGNGNGQFLAPADLAVDADGNVYVVDDGRREIQKFDGEGRFLLTFGGRGETEQIAHLIGAMTIDAAGVVWVTDAGDREVKRFSADGEPLGSWEITNAGEIAVDAQGRVFVGDWSRNRVQVFDGDGRLLATWGKFGMGEGAFWGPVGLALDGQGNVYVSEDNGNRVQKFRLLPPLAP